MPYDDKNLRKQTNYKQSKWTIKQIKAGLELYKELNGNYPSSHEIDTFEYLPSSRSIQRSLGGLEKVREALGFDLSLTNLTKGTIRSKKAHSIYRNAVSLEDSFYKYLIHTIAEVRVHEHKILRPGHVCCDFFVYTSENAGFAIDIFFAQDLFTLARIVHIKQKRYQELKCRVYFVVVGNEDLKQENLDETMTNKKQKLPGHIKVLTGNNFKKNFEIILKG